MSTTASVYPAGLQQDNAPTQTPAWPYGQPINQSLPQTSPNLTQLDFFFEGHACIQPLLATLPKLKQIAASTAVDMLRRI